MKDELKFVVNRTTAKAERRQHAGREYLVAPTVAIVEGVMNGLLYTADEMTRHMEVWNGKPLSLAHPKDQAGNHISANSPDQHAISPGFFFNAKFEGGKLKGEWWIDTAKAQQIGGDAARAMKMLEAGEMVEQSTGLFLDVEEAEGIFNNQKYVGIARNIRPDHVAILLNEPGACSIADGCGTPRANNKQESDGGIKEAAEKILNYFKSGFALDREPAMNEKEKLIKALVANEKCPFSAEQLDSSDENALKAFEALLAANEQIAESEAGAPDQGDETEDEKPDTQNEVPESITEFAAMVDEFGGVGAMKEALASIKANSDQARNTLVSQIVANTKFTEDELSGLGIPQLQKMADAVRPASTGLHLRPAPTANEDQASEWEAYEAPEPALNGQGGK